MGRGCDVVMSLFGEWAGRVRAACWILRSPLGLQRRLVLGPFVEVASLGAVVGGGCCHRCLLWAGVAFGN